MREDLNLQQVRPERTASANWATHPLNLGGPGRTRTFDQLLMGQTLWPTELQALNLVGEKGFEPLTSCSQSTHSEPGWTTLRLKRFPRLRIQDYTVHLMQVSRCFGNIYAELTHRAWNLLVSTFSPLRGKGGQSGGEGGTRTPKGYWPRRFSRPIAYHWHTSPKMVVRVGVEPTVFPCGWFTVSWHRH